LEIAPFSSLSNSTISTDFFGRSVTRIRSVSAVLRAISNANAGTRTLSLNNGAGPGVWVEEGVAGGGSRCAFKSNRAAPPEPEASRRGCPARDQAQQRGGLESERGERMTRIRLYRAG
jgi:hypothetical protein